MADDKSIPDAQPASATPTTAASPQVQQFPTDYTQLSTVYTNFCRVNVTPEELVLDFGLNTQLSPNPEEPVRLTHRVVMNFYTAKRLLMALNNVVTQHERNYGVLELDFQRRAQSRTGGAPTATGVRPGTPPTPGAPPTSGSGS